MLVYAFVGMEKSFDKPFGVGFNHPDAKVCMRDSLECDADVNVHDAIKASSNQNNFYGFINEVSPGVLEIVDRNEAFVKAKIHRQLKNEHQMEGALQSYEVKFNMPHKESRSKVEELRTKAAKLYAEELKRIKEM